MTGTTVLIIRGGDVHQNPRPTKRQCSAGCGKGIIASSKAISVMSVMRGPMPAARTLYRFDSTTVWLSN